MWYGAQDVDPISMADERTGHVQRVRVILVEKKDAICAHSCECVLLRNAERESDRRLKEVEVPRCDVDINVPRP